MLNLSVSTSMLKHYLFDEARLSMWWRSCENNPGLLHHNSVISAESQRRQRTFTDSSYHGILTTGRSGIDIAGLVKNIMKLTGQSPGVSSFAFLLPYKMVLSLLGSALAVMCTIWFDLAHPPV